MGAYVVGADVPAARVPVGVPVTPPSPLRPTARRSSCVYSADQV